MAYATTNPPQLLVPSMGGSPALWVYKSTDAHGTVVGAGYFTNGAALGLKANDVVIVIDSSTPTCTIHGASSATTLRAATLA